ncbi:MDN1 [Cryptosporidium sp. chipmunk genotype I]|uniref:MDN1 n=1 Tax=Cryptosporidium sp. chipmunk genotype I TaxID=1280935 RepID=UPI00351A8F35|nr:MDN1 [Cryptosporidium sp. chipmunk genotype I]
MSLIERSNIILQEVILREDQIKLTIKDKNYKFGTNLKDAISQLEEVLSILDNNQLQNSELISRITLILRRMVLYPEIGDIVLERFPVIIFGLIEDIFKEGVEYKEHCMLEALYVSRYLYLVVSLLELPYFVDSFSLFWYKEQERNRELLLLLENINNLLLGLDEIREINKEEVLNKVRDLVTLNLLWERVIPIRDYLKANCKLYEIIERFMLNLKHYKELNKTIKYLFLRLYSNVVQLGEEGKIQLYRENNLEDLFVSIQMNQEYASNDDIDLYLQYFIFKRPHFSAFTLVFGKSHMEMMNKSLKNDIQITKRIQDEVGLNIGDQVNKSRDINESTILDIYDEEIINNLKELVLSNILTKTSLIFLENINNGMQIYFNLINHIKVSYFQEKHHFKIVRLYLDNNIDSKSLLGNWVVGNKPGEFKWEYGILSQCLINGDWLLIENIQDSPKDVIIKLNEISEKICHPLVNRYNITQTRIQETHYFELSEFNRKIKIHPNFRIFSSCVFSNQNNSLNSSNNTSKENYEKFEIINPCEHINTDILKLLNNDKWSICSIPTPTSKELRKGIETNYKNLSSIKEELLESFSNLVSFMNNPNSFSGTNIAKSLNTRRPSCNDFFKGCESVSRQYFSVNRDYKSSTFLNEKLRMKISILFGSVLLDHISLKSYRNRCQIEISKSFGINSNESEYYLKNGKFDIHLINKGEQSRNVSSINIVNKELSIDINVNLLRYGLRNSMDSSPSRLVLKSNHQDDYKYVNYTFTSIHSKLLFKVIMSIYNNENILLVGDTGTGKTTIIQQLHYMLYGSGKNYINEHLEEGEDKFCELLVYNFNEQSESSDIIGSFRPINIYNEVKLLYDDYLVLLERSNISRKKNETIINYLLLLLRERKWVKFINNLIIIIDKLLGKFDNILKNQASKKVNEQEKSEEIGTKVSNSDKKKVKKRSAVNIEDIWTLKIYWKDLKQKCLIKLKDNRILNSENERQKHYFEFLDGILLKAVKEGHWLILDEINLASIDILQRLIPILNRVSNRNESSEIEIIDNNANHTEKVKQARNRNSQIMDSDYLIIPEKGNESIKIHPRFRLFSCMNPVSIPIEQSEQISNNSQGDDFQHIQIKSTSGKKDLPQLIRAFFTEYFVDELTDRKDLEDVVYNYLKDVLLTNQINISTLVDIYLELKNMGNKHEITVGLEGNGHGIPNFSLRTFSTCLSYIRTILMLQANWRRNQNQLKLIESIGENGKCNDYNANLNSGNSIIQNAILKQEISEIIHNGIMMSFATPLVSESYNKVDKLVRRILKMNLKEPSRGKSLSLITPGTSKHVDMNCVSFLAPRLGSEETKTLSSGKANFINYMLITDYVVRMGTYNKNFKLNSAISNDFVITPYVEQNLRKILRILSGSRNPILIEGETSTGKTSLIKYISELTNHKFVRINNHEHTDTEEYFGKFIPNNQGELEFVEGPLVNSIRNGYWLVLDELNLAPSEVLESLNRLLDSNREIYIPETGETIKAHEDFMLFATQNPAGSIYGGRKVLSQAFRNRFVEIYFDEIPSKELEVIISKRSNIPFSYSELMVKVFMELKRHRSKSQMFSGDFSFVTVRDLLRWGNRLVNSKDNVLDKKNLVIQGFYVIGERIRDSDEKLQLAEILFNICKPFEIKSVDEIINYSTSHISSLREDIYDERLKKKRKKEAAFASGNREDCNISKDLIISMVGFNDPDKNLMALKDLINKNGDYILTDSFKRMLTLVNDCIVFNEPVILVGSTGCGKTSIFQLLSTLYKKQLYIVNCHQQIEASDMLGSLRPIRSRILRLSQELNNFKIELLAINSRIYNNIDANYVQKGFGDLIISKVGELNGLLDDSGNNCNSKFNVQFSERKEQIQVKITCLITLIESALKELEDSTFPDILLLFENILNELKLYQNGELEKEQTLFEWQDGPIIKAMKTGSFLLLDEINLCDDSVIERLNSLLEDQLIKSESGLSYKSRVIYLTEKGGAGSFNGNDDYIIHSHKDFRIFATMNPSGDYGKRELSPALRNRFNEIFVPSLSIYQLKNDIEFLVFKNISKLSQVQVSEMNKKMLSKCIIVFSILYENEIKNDQILNLRALNKDQETGDYFNLMIKNGIKLFKEDDNQSFVAFGGDSGNSSDVKEYTIRDIISWCQFICNNFQGISNFYNSNKEIVIDYIKKNEHGQEFLRFKNEDFGNNQSDNYSSVENMILTTLVLGELFIQGASMLILDGLSTHNNEFNKEEVVINLQLTYVERLIEVFYTYLINPSFQEKSIVIGKIIKEILNFRFLSDQGNNWIKVGGGKVLIKELNGDKFDDLKENTDGYLFINQDSIELGPFKIQRKRVLGDHKETSSSNSFLPSYSSSDHSSQKTDKYIENIMKKFTFDSKTTLRNFSSIIRSMSIMKPILLEGAPGIGKTAIILTLSKLVGVRLHRINMSEQTDFSDLFGCEVPNSGGSVNQDLDQKQDQFQNQDQGQNHDSQMKKRDGRLIKWIDGILLYAMKNGDWVILDELNLATQQILEGLNSVMDHRRNIYIPEIGQTILCHENFRIFATQNPVKVGSSGRKGLPQSFLNRFVRINVGKLTYEDYFIICKSLFLDKNNCLTEDLIRICIEITQEIEQFSMKFNTIRDASIWEWNLRDIIRLLRFVQLNLTRNLTLRKKMISNITKMQIVNSVYCSFETVYLSRFRTKQDYDSIQNIIKKGLNQIIGKNEEEKLFEISGIVDNIMNPNNIDNYYKHTGNHCNNLKKMLVFEDYLKSYILNGYNNNFVSITKDIYRVADYFKDLDFNILPISSKKRIVSIIDCILLGENVILTCNSGDRMEEVILSIESISKNYFNNIKVNKVNILPSIDANDLIGGYQQYNQDNIINEVFDLVSSLRVDFDHTINELELFGDYGNFKGKNLLNRLNWVKFNNILNIRNEEFILELRNYLNFLKEVVDMKKVIITPIGIIQEIESKLQVFELMKNNTTGSSETETNEGPKFQFTFSTLINSIKNGDWLIITNIQNCSSALLDRLNSLLEDKENDLFIIESGIPQYIKRHENFRLFFINDYNIQNKYISNALINRCIDIFIDDEREDDEFKFLKINPIQTETFETDNHYLEKNLEKIDSEEDSHLKEILRQILYGFRLSGSLEGVQANLLSQSQNQESNIENDIQMFTQEQFILGILLNCDNCIEEILVSIVDRSKRYNRKVLDFVKFNYMDQIEKKNKNKSNDLSFITNMAIYLVFIIINGVNNYVLDYIIKIENKVNLDEHFLASHSDKNSLCIKNTEKLRNIFQCLKRKFLKDEHIQVMKTIGNGDGFFINWMRNLLFSALISSKKFKRITKSHVFSVIEDSMIITFKQLGFIQVGNSIEVDDGSGHLNENENEIENHFINFYMMILKLVENWIFDGKLQQLRGKEVVLSSNMSICNDFYQLYVSKMIPRQLNPIFKEIVIKRYDHIHEQYRELVELILRRRPKIEKCEFWMDLLDINYLFLVYLRDIMNHKNIFENVLYLTILLKEITKFDDYINYQNVQIKVLYVKSIINLVLKLFDINLTEYQDQDESLEILSRNEILMLEALRKYITNSDLKTLTSIFSLIFSPIMRINEKMLVENVLKFTNKFSFTINSIILDSDTGNITSNQEDFKNLIKQYIYDQKNVKNYYGLSFEERESLTGLLEICEYYCIKETKRWILEFLIQILTSIEDMNKNQILDLLQLFELLEDNILILDLEKKEIDGIDNKGRLKSNELLKIFDTRIKNGISLNIIKLIRMKLKNEDIIKYQNKNNNIIIKVIPKNKTYLETIYESEISFLGYGVIINKDNFNMQKSLKNSFKVLRFLINKKKINLENILQYFTQVQLCNLEFLDLLLKLGDDKKVLWRQLITQIEDFNKDIIYEEINNSSNNNSNISSDLKEEEKHSNYSEAMGLSSVFFEYYLMKQYLRSQFELILRKGGKIERENLLGYLSYLRELILKSDNKYYNKTHIIGIMIQVIKLLSINDSYVIYLDYFKKKRFNNNNLIKGTDGIEQKNNDKVEIEILENMKKNHLMTILLDLDISYEFEIEDSFDLGNETLQENLLVDIIKESFVMMIKSDNNSNSEKINEKSKVNLGKEFEHILKIIMKFDTGIIKLLFLNSIYHRLFNFKFYQVINLKSEYLSLFYYFNNQEIIQKDDSQIKGRNSHIKRVTGYFIKVIIDFLTFINITKFKIENNIDLDDLLDIIFLQISGNANNQFENDSIKKEMNIKTIQLIQESINFIRNQDLYPETLLTILKKYFEFIYLLITIPEENKQVKYFNSNNNIKISGFEVLIRTCLVVINLPIYYHCRNLFYIDENKVYSEYNKRIFKDQENMDIKVKSRYLSYFHHFHSLKGEKYDFVENIKEYNYVIRKFDQDFDDRKEFVIVKMEEIITEILENDLIMEFLDNINQEKQKTCSITNLRRLENFVIMIQNILSKNNLELFQEDLSYFYSDVLCPFKLLLNSLVYGIIGITLFDNSKNLFVNNLLENPKKQSIKSLNMILDTFEYEHDLGLLPINFNNNNNKEFKIDITVIELWKSLLEVGNYIHEYNTEFLSLYNKYYQDFEYNVHKTHEKLIGNKNQDQDNEEGEENFTEYEKDLNQFISESHLIYRNDNIDKFIEKNNILNEFDLMNELINQSDKLSELGSESKYSNIKYICLKILEIIILRYGSDQGFKYDIVRQTTGITFQDHNYQMKKYIFYNMTYNDIKQLNFQNEYGNKSDQSIWRFILLHLNQHKIFSQDSGIDSANSYQHIKVHIDDQVFIKLINNEKKVSFNNNIQGIGINKNILKNSELSTMIDLVDKIQLMEKLKEILNQTDQLLLEYDNQPILVMIKDIVEKIIIMNIQKLNIITLICYLDILLMRLLKWQEYIKEGLNLNIEINNSMLGKSVDFIRYSIYQFRKLQINSWFNLIFKIYQKYNYMASFSFGNILVIISKIMIEYQEFNHNLIYHEIFDYLKTSTKGEYPIRFLFLRYISDLIIKILDYPKRSESSFISTSNKNNNNIDFGQFSFTDNQIIKLTKLSKIINLILSFGEVIYREILKDNQKLLQDIKTEIRDIIKLSMWEVKDYNKIKKNILSIQKQLKKNLLKFDERLMIRVDLLINGNSNIDINFTNIGQIKILPRLTEFIRNSELKGEEGIGYIIKLLSDGNLYNNKMLKQRYYKTLIDMDTYNLEKLININNFNDFYYSNLDQYINLQKDYNIKISSMYKDDSNSTISLCFLILDQLRLNESGKYNMQYMNQSLINYNKLLSIGNTLLNNLIMDYQEFQSDLNLRFLVYNYLLSINSVDSSYNLNNGKNLRFCMINDDHNNEMNNIISLREYLNYLLKILNHLERIKILISSPLSTNDSSVKTNNTMIEFLIKDKLKHDKQNNQIISFIIDRIINKRLLKMISKLKNMFYISGLIHNNCNNISKKGNYWTLINWELMDEIENFNFWIKTEIEELINTVNLNLINNGIFELDIIQDYISKLITFSLDFNTENSLVKELEIIDLFCSYDLITRIKQEEESEEVEKIQIKIFKFGKNIKLDEYKSKFLSEYDSKYENLKSLSGLTLEYIQALYILLENEFFNICEKKEEEEDGLMEGNNGTERNPNIDWKSGCGFGNKDDNDYQSKDISSELNNDDSLLEGLKGEDENERPHDDKLENKNKDEKKNKDDAVDTELDFNSKLEDLDDDDEDNEDNKNQKDDEIQEVDPEKVFDNVDLENKNSKIEDVKNQNDDEKEENDDEKNEGDNERKKENIETKNKNQEEENNKNGEKDIVAKFGGNESEQEDEKSKEEDKKKDKDEEKSRDLEEMNEVDEKDEINSLDSDLDELFEYDAKNINPYINEEENSIDKEEGEGGEEDIERENRDDIDDNITISDMEDGTFNDQQELGEGEYDNEYEDDDYQFGDNIVEEEEEEDGDSEMNVDRYQSLGYQNDMDEEVKEEEKKDQDKEGKGDNFDRKTSMNENKGKNGLKAHEKELKDESNNYDDKDIREESSLEKENKEEDDNQDEKEGGIKIEEDEGYEGKNEDNGSDKVNEFRSKKDEKEEELMNPLLEDNRDDNRNWYNSMKDLIIQDEENEEYGENDDFEEFDPNNNCSNFKIDRDINSKSNIIQNLPSFGNKGSNNKIDVDIREERYEKKDFDNQIIEQAIENFELYEEGSIENNKNKDDSLNKINNRMKNMFSEGEYENEDEKFDARIDNDDESNVFNFKENNNIEMVMEMEGNDFKDKNRDKEKNINICNSSLNSIGIWNKIQSEITPIVNSLSNQLRIILEPTMRGKMEGGFKTGKKLSMKKVITYIASDYRKDKIWLRRSKPSKREFNILMCIDNSQSMSVSNNEYMALQSLLIIIQSLQKIEVGNFGVCSFTGENIKQLIEMTSQINSNDAINMLNYFSFSEETLDSHQNSIPKILEYSTNLLKDFGNSNNNSGGGSNNQCHQLIIIITDGRFNKSKVNVWINYAIQNNCIPVLVIIDNIKNNNGKDNGSSSSSIFNMKSVNKDENGKMIITPYLENFPFPYYSVIQDPKKLPNILCELIKQWFELICN